MTTDADREAARWVLDHFLHALADPAWIVTALAAQPEGPSEIHDLIARKVPPEHLEARAREVLECE